MRWLRWIGIGVLSIVALLVVIGLILYLQGARTLGRRLSVEMQPVEVPSDPASIAEGKRLVAMYGCTECHGAELEGQVMISSPVFGRLVAPHIAPGVGSVTATFTDEDWLRAIRHGIGGDGRPLVVMPASEFNALSGDEVSKIVAYVKQVPPVSNVLPKSRFLLAQIMMGANMVPFDYDLIDHTKAARATPASDDITALGEYRVQLCRACHGKDLMGDEESGGPQLAQGGRFDAYDEETFGRLLETGVAADGRHLDPARMPWEGLREMSAEERHAVWVFVKSVPAPTPP